MSQLRFLASVALISVLLPSLQVFAQQSEIQWEDDYQRARQAAADAGKPLLIHFWSETCGPCRKLDTYVFPHPEVVRAVNGSVVAVKVNAMKNRELAKKFGVRRIPTDIFVSSSGDELWRSISPDNARDYVSMVDRVSQKDIKRDPTANELASHARGNYTPPAAVEAPKAPTQPQDAAAENQSDYAPRGGTFGGGFVPESKPQERNNQFVTNQYSPEQASRGGGAFNQSNPANNSAPQRDSRSQFGVGAGRQPQRSPQDNGFVTNNPHVASPPSHSAAPRRPRDDFRGGLASQPPQPATPPMNPPVGPTNAARFALDGYCPVTLVTEKRWVKGDPRWGVNHRGRVYLFSSEQQQQRFWSAPDAFSPILSGFDPVALVEQRRWIEGRREHGVFYKDRATGQVSVCLFESETALQRFWQDPRRFTAEARQAMQSMSAPNRR